MNDRTIETFNIMKTMNTTYTTTASRGVRWGALLAILLVVAGCDKSIDVPGIPTLVPSSLDTTGGSWKTVSTPVDSIPQVTLPPASGYAAELAEVKQLQSAMSATMESDIRYWSGGAAIRWNEIARALVIKYNVAPPVGAAPNPLKPFTNPPFSSRAYALLSVAQYDALVSVWKNRYSVGVDRRPPYIADPSIKAIVPITSAPSFPSEHGAVAAASYEVLKFLFPGDSAYLAERLLNAQESRIVSGANVRSEVLAGDSLGRAAAARVIARAKNDGAKNGRGGDTLFTDPTKWVSLETPARPPMLPLWGKVRLWTTPSVEIARPDPPPAIGSAEFQKALEEVRSYSDNRTREQWRIADFWADGAGTTTPPGHWNIIACEHIRKNAMNELRAARTLALLNMAMSDAAVCCWDVKYLYVYPRPSQMDPEIKTATGIPNFPSYTSGHSTFSAAAAEVLSYLFPAQETTFKQYAEEAAMSRLYAGIHYRFDNEAGLHCGSVIGKHTVDFGKADGSPAYN